MIEQPRTSTERGYNARHPDTYDAPLPERAGCLAPDADLIRTTALLGAA